MINNKHVIKRFSSVGFDYQRNDYKMTLDKGGINRFKATLISIFKKTKDYQLILHQFCTMRSYKQVTKGQNLF